VGDPVGLLWYMGWSWLGGDEGFRQPWQPAEFALFVCSFLCLPKETNQRKGTLCLLSRRWRDARRSSMLPGLCKLGFASNSAKPFFGSLSGARLRANGIELLWKQRVLIHECIIFSHG
jgi:hypothetical protein